MTEFAPAGKVTDVDVNSMTAFEIDGREIVVANLDGRYVAFDGRCTCMSLFSGHLEDADPHSRRALLSNGHLSAGTVTCQTHATIYSVDSGSPLKGLARSHLIHMRFAKKLDSFSSQRTPIANDASGTTPKRPKQPPLRHEKRAAHLSIDRWRRP